MTQAKQMPKGKPYESEDLNYKYNILARLQKKTTFKRQEIIDAVIKKSGYELSAVKRLIYRKDTEKKTTNYEILEAFALSFGCPVEELKTVKI